MKNFTPWFRNSWFRAAILAIAAIPLTSPQPAHADTYQIYYLGSGYLDTLVGIEASGTVVIFDRHAPCSIQATECYESFSDGVIVSKSTTNPNPVYDNGTPCTAPATLSGYNAAGVCNNGHAVYTTPLAIQPPPGPYSSSLFTGPDPATDLFANGIFNEVFLNSSGDFAYLEDDIGENYGEIYEAVDLTTTAVPEPGTVVLLGTGILAAVATLRRRLHQ